MIGIFYSKQLSQYFWKLGPSCYNKDYYNFFYYFRLNIGLDSSVNTANQGSLVTNKDKNDVIFT